MFGIVRCLTKCMGVTHDVENITRVEFPLCTVDCKALNPFIRINPSCIIRTVSKNVGWCTPELVSQLFGLKPPITIWCTYIESIAKPPPT